MRAMAMGLLAAMLCAGNALAADAPVQVMVVGTFHMSNPGRDLHNVTVDDVLAEKPQGEIARVAAALARFRPTMVAVEWPDDADTHDRYAKYLAGTLAPSRNEVVQLGFRAAKLAGLTAIAGADADGDFPYEAVDAYAKAHGQAALLEAAHAEIGVFTETQSRLLTEKGIAATLRWSNEPALVAGGNGFYRNMLRVGGGAEQPGADLLRDWYARNFRICVASSSARNRAAG